MKYLVIGLTTIGLLTTGAAFAQTNQKGADAASGNDNQAVATTTANAPAPAKGANSFTMNEAKSRIERSGFSNVGGLTKDDNGVWHGNAQKGSDTTTVWLDYKGNVGESTSRKLQWHYVPLPECMTTTATPVRS
jgi:putative membrane protein